VLGTDRKAPIVKRVGERTTVIEDGDLLLAGPSR
jgi:hypothetical protein